MGCALLRWKAPTGRGERRTWPTAHSRLGAANFVAEVATDPPHHGARLQVLASKGAQHAQRGRTLLQAFQNPNRSAAAAATAASNAAGG